MGRADDGAAQDVAQLRQWLDEGRKPTRDACIAARLVAGEHQDEDQAAASCCSRPIPSAEAAANDGSVGRDRSGRDGDAAADSELRRHSSLDMSRSTMWRALHEDLQARCFKPVRAPRLTAENRLARLNFCRGVLQRVGVLSIRGKRHLKPLDLTRVVFSDKKFFETRTKESHRRASFFVGAGTCKRLESACLDLGKGNPF